MATVSFEKLWNNHPYPDTPCSTKYFKDQCAIRMGVALRGAAVDLSDFRGAKCYPGLKHEPKHILRAEELANWIAGKTTLFGERVVSKKVTHTDYFGKKGIIFIKDGWGSGDHIDVWDGKNLKGGDTAWFARGKQVWYWELQ